MSDDPFLEDESEPLPPSGRKPRGSAKAKRAAMAPEDVDEGERDLNRTLAGQLCSDLGNAKRLIARFGQDLIFVRNLGWFAWDAKRWDREGGADLALKRAHATALAIFDEAKALKEDPAEVGNEERLNRLYGWAVTTSNATKAASMLSTAAPYVTRSPELLDADPMLLSGPNGTIHVKSQCEALPHRREDYITRLLGTPYKEGADCPLFLKFIERIMPDEEMRSFLQRILGYCLTGSRREQAFFIFYGTGLNGKSTLMNVVKHIMGEYALASPVATFLAKRDGKSGSDHSADLARLPGAHMVMASEPPEGARLDEAVLKAMTGGEPMTVRDLNKGFFEFRPVFKLVLCTNYRPIIRGTDRGIWRRVRLVPFTVEIPEDEADRDLETKLIAEASGILNWILDGAEEWLNIGLRPPEKAIAAVESYRADSDLVGEFLKARCEVTGDWIDPQTTRRPETIAKALRDAYCEWCKSEGLDVLSARSFWSKIAGRGIENRKSNGKTYYTGVSLTQPATDAPDAQ